MMKKLFTLLFLFSFPFYNYAQNIDSLKNVIANSPVDTAKIDAYIELANYFEHKNIDSAIYYAEKGIELAKKEKDKKGEMILYQPYGISLARKGNFREAMQVFERKKQLAKELNDKKRFIKSLSDIGVMYRALNNLDSALFLYEKVLELSIENNYPTLISIAYQNIGNINYYRDNFYSAISFYHKSLDATDMIKPKNERDRREVIKGKADVYNNIAACFHLMLNFREAIEAYKKTLELYNKIDDALGVKTIYSNIGSAYLGLNKLDSAEYYIKKSFEIANDAKLKQNISTEYHLLGKVYLRKHEYEKALKYLKKAIEKRKKENSLELNVSYYIIAEVYLQIMNYEKAKKYLKLAEEITEYDSDLREIYFLYKELYEKEGKYKKALHYANLFSELNDSIYNYQNLSLIKDLNTKYETEKKEADNLRLKSEVALQKAEVEALKSKQLFIIALASLIILILVFMFFIIKKRNTEKINKMKFKEIGKNNHKIARDLHDGIGGYHSALKMMLESKDGLNREINIIDDAQKALRFQLYKLKAPEILDENFDFINEIKSFANFIKNIAGFNLNLEINNPKNINKIRYEYKMHLYNITKELLTNAMKYAEASEVNISITQKNNHLIYTYSDNGKGFDMNSKFKGEGINNIQQRAKQIYGILKFESMPNKGTKLNLNIPLKKMFILKPAV